jgi:hypothetical protein
MSYYHYLISLSTEALFCLELSTVRKEIGTQTLFSRQELLYVWYNGFFFFKKKIKKSIIYIATLEGQIEGFILEFHNWLS